MMDGWATVLQRLFWLRIKFRFLYPAEIKNYNKQEDQCVLTTKVCFNTNSGTQSIAKEANAMLYPNRQTH